MINRIHEIINFIINMFKRKSKSKRTYIEVHPEIMFMINKPFAKYISFEEV